MKVNENKITEQFSEEIALLQVILLSYVVISSQQFRII